MRDFYQLLPEYLTAERFTSYAFQYTLIQRWVPKDASILEIGCGAGILTQALRLSGYGVQTVDIEERVRPDIVGDIRTLEYAGKTDVIAAFQIFEHIPYEDFEKTLYRVSSIATDAIVISLPDVRPSIGIGVKVPKFPYGFKVFSVPFVDKKKVPLENAHFWEIGLHGITPRTIRRSLMRSGFRLVWHSRFVNWPYHHFFVAKKSN